jgi:hypothetical protein
MSNEAAKLLKGIGDPESKGWILGSIDVRGQEVALRKLLTSKSEPAVHPLVKHAHRSAFQRRNRAIVNVPEDQVKPNKV